MAVEIQVKVNVNDNDALQKITALSNAAEKLRSADININVNTTGLDKLNSQSVKGLNALSRIVSAQANYDTAQNKSATATAKLTTAQARMIKERRLATQQAEKYNKAEEQTAKTTEKMSKAMSDASRQQGFFESVLGTSLGKYILRLGTYQAVSGAIYGTVSAFKDALKTMKEVDSELASIQKVTDFSPEQMKGIEKGAYSVASQYGVSAQEYLESVSAFAKAGYKDLADDLGELAIKTQLVGDVTASTANQFLLSVDAAWKMGGSVEDLSRVLDEANIVENNYATSIDKLAQGMPNVASVASMVGMSAEETIAALGTITAVTQQSGTKAATALRALILNIMKDTTTEVEEGVTVTKEQVETLDEVLQVYAKDALDAAKATGEIVNPMKVVAALAQAYGENKITKSDLAKIEVALGGKLRTVQLDALLKNFDMFEKMMGKIGESAGSADKEIDIMLNTWEAKSNILKNTWTEFVSKTISTDLFKGLLDRATQLLNVVGDLGTALEVVGGILAAKFAFNLPNTIAKVSEAIGTVTKKLFDFYKLDMTSDEYWKGETPSVGGRLAMAGVAVAITAAVIAVQKYKQNVKEAAEAALVNAENSAKQTDSIIDLVSAYKQAEESSEQQEAASKKLAEALGLEGEAVDSLKDKYMGLAAARSADNVTDAVEAEAAAAKALEAEYNLPSLFHKTGVRYTDLDLQREQSGIVELIRNSLEGSSAVRFDRGTGEYKASDTTAEGILAYYNQVLSTIDLVKTEAGNLDDKGYSVFHSKMYQDLVDTASALKESADAYQKTKDMVQEAQIRDYILQDQQQGLLDTKEEFDAYKKNLEENIKDNELLEKKLNVLQKLFPEFSGYVSESTDALAEQEAQANATANALERYKNAMSGGKSGGMPNKDDNWQTMAGAYDAMMKAGKKKMFGSNEFLAGKDLLLGDFGKGMSNEDAYKYLQGMKEFFSGDSMGTGLKNLIEAKNAAGELDESLASIEKNGDGTFNFNITDDPDKLLDVADALGVSAEAIIFAQQAMGNYDENIDIQGLQDLLDKIQKAREDREKAKEGKEGEEADVSVETEGADEAVGELEKVKNEAQEVDSQSPTVDANAEGAEEAAEAIEEVKDEAEAAESTQPNIQVTADVGGAMTNLAAVAQRVNNLPSSKTITINIVVNGEIPNIGGNAEGTSNFKGGLTWVNEQKGGFNPELIETGGKSFFVNGGKPALVALPKGAVIYNATETRKLFAEGNDITEVMHHDNGTNIPDLSRRSGIIAGIGNGKGKGSSASSSDWWEKLQEYMEDLLEKAGDALDEQLEAIEAELFYLQYGKEVSEKATELEEARMNLLEAEQELINAQTERTVRYFNAETGQWEWMADQKDIIKAQEELAERQKDYLKAQYDYLEDVWSELKDDIQKAIDGKKDVNIAKVLEQMLKSKAGGLTGNVEGLIGDLLNLITAFSNGTALDSYDSGGIANGLGYMYKATKADEVVLNGKLSNAILSPKRSQQFADFTSSLERMFGMSSMIERPRSMAGFSTSDNHSTNVYMNGIKIGSDMLNKPLSEVLSVLPIYCN